MGILSRAEEGVEEYRRTLLPTDTRISLGRRKRNREKFRSDIMNDGGEDERTQFCGQVQILLIILVVDVSCGYRRVMGV